VPPSCYDDSRTRVRYLLGVPVEICSGVSALAYSMVLGKR
jgi:hypothetical protein